MKALLLVDIQNDFIPGGALPVPGGDQIIEVTNKLQAHFDLVVATQDWHPLDHKSFAANHPGKNDFEEIELDGLRQVLWPSHCVQGSWGADFAPALDTKPVEVIFRKGTDSNIDSYSGFYDNGHRKSTALADYLRSKKIDQIYIAGLAADYCVYYTAKDAIEEGFSTFIIEDAVRAINEDGYTKAKAHLQSMGGKIIFSSLFL